jgi:hypothetical protein
MPCCFKELERFLRAGLAEKMSLPNDGAFGGID